MPIGIGKLSWLETLETFVVGPEDSGRDITELQGLNHLRGHLEIRGLEHVRNGAEAKQANLASKQNLSSLELGWRDISSNIHDVIQGLQPSPHGSLKDLSISGYGGSAYPSWMKLLVNLVVISLSYGSKCEDLPPLGHLPLLRKLQIHGMDSLKRINKEFYGSCSSEAAGVFFPSLEELDFSFMRNWEEWESLDHQQVFPCLKKLWILNCPNLPSLPFSILHSVQELEFNSNCEKLIVRSLPCLRLLRLSNVSSIPVGSLQNLDALQSLELGYCEFASIPQQIQNLASLKSLDIMLSSSLTSLSQSLPSLSSLETLSISFCFELEFSSGDFQQLHALQSLILWVLPKLTSLPDLQHLPTLQSLEIGGCKNLRVLPQWMQNLTSLHTLYIDDCHPDLHLKCKKDNGEYWPYISHIPQFYIN